MNIEAVRGFVAVAEEGQFQLAADRLDVSQQAVSKRIAALEAELGTALFKRTPSGAALTQDGRTFLPHAGAILAAVSAAFASVQPGTRPLRVDVLSRGSGPVDLLRDFCADNPSVAVEMIIGGGAASTMRSLLAGEIDAGFAYLRDVAGELNPALERAYAFLEPTHVIAGARHPLARSREVRPDDLARYRAWVPGIVAGSEWETFYQDFAAAFGLDIDPTGYAVGSESVFDAVAASRSLVTLVGARSRVGWPGGLGLVRLPVVDPVPAYPWSLTWRADTGHQGALRLAEHVRNSFEPPPAGTAIWLPRQARDDLAALGARRTVHFPAAHFPAAMLLSSARESRMSCASVGPPRSRGPAALPTQRWKATRKTATPASAARLAPGSGTPRRRSAPASAMARFASLISSRSRSSGVAAMMAWRCRARSRRSSSNRATASSDAPTASIGGSPAGASSIPLTSQSWSMPAP